MQQVVPLDIQPTNQSASFYQQRVHCTERADYTSNLVMTDRPSIELNNGISIPALGFGTFAESLVPGKTHTAVVAALKAGYRHLDCAWIYENEEEVGAGIREFLTTTPVVSRADLFITTKVWPHLAEPDDVVWSLTDSLKKLGTDYVDLFLIHWPFACERTDDYKEKKTPDGKYIIKKGLTENPEPTWRAMERLYEAGKAKAIGVSNWTIPGLESLLKYADIKPAVNQIEIHPYFPNTELVKYCFDQGIIPVAYSPLGSQEGTGERIFADKELQDLAKSKSVSMAQLLIAWGLKRGYAVLPKSQNEDRVRSNFNLIELNEVDFAVLNRAEGRRGYRFVSCKDLNFGYDVWPEESR